MRSTEETRVPPTSYEHLPANAQAAHDAHARIARITNMKRTLLHSVPAFDALMTWYPLRDAVQPFLGERLTTLFAHAISAETDCLICSTFFRRLLIEAGENPDGSSSTTGSRRWSRSAGSLAVDAARRARRALRSRWPRQLSHGADRGADRVRRADGRHQRLQQRARRGAGRLPGALPQGARRDRWVNSAGRWR